MNYHKISKYDIANGLGIGTVLWVSGCNHHCKNCHNPETWNPLSGQLYTSDTTQEILNSLSPEYISRLTLSGGDPLYPSNREDITLLSSIVKKRYPNKQIWLYTGYLYEDIKDLSIMNYIDVLVDGTYIDNLRDVSLPYCGSSNQKVIDVKRSLESGEIYEVSM